MQSTKAGAIVVAQPPSPSQDKDTFLEEDENQETFEEWRARQDQEEADAKALQQAQVG